jgi:hypothetical protein
MKSTAFGRRGLVLSLAAGTLALSAGSGRKVLAGQNPALELFARLFRSPDRAAAVGERYLAGQGGSMNAGDLLDEIRKDSAIDAAIAEGKIEPLRETVRARVLEDLEKGRVARVQGWIVAETEAKVCGLCALARISSVS